MKQDNGVQEEIPCETTNQACIEEDKIITSSPNEVKNDNKIEKKEEYTPELNTLVNINTADKEALMTLKGIGESKADKIIDYRNSHGHFKTIEEIKNVSGIGDSIYEKIKELITVE